MPTVKYSVSAYIADGTTTDYLITWDYLDDDHITVEIDGLSNADPTASHTFTKLNDTTVRVTDGIGGAIAAGKEIQLRRSTPITTRPISFSDGSALLAADLNKNSDYLLYSMQEALDQVDFSVQYQEEAEGFRDATQALRDESQAFRNLSESDAAEADLHRIAAALSETNAAASVVTNTALVSDAAASEDAAQVSATNAAGSAATAATQAALATTNGEAQVTLATAQATLATTNGAAQVTLATAQATNSQVSAAASEASKIASGVSADNASVSETNAASSATNAATSASSAQASKDAALAALDSFDDRYLGQKTSDVTVDNDGNALVSGSLYFNTTDNVMKVYEGSSWVAAYASLSGALISNSNLSDLASTSEALSNLGFTATLPELNNVAGINSSVQTQLDAKASATDLSTAINGLGTASALDVGTGANQVVQLDGSGQLPALNASNLTGIDGVSAAALIKFGAL